MTTKKPLLEHQKRRLNEGRIFDQSKTINVISGELGFKYQQHFTRLFKLKTG